MPMQLFQAKTDHKSGLSHFPTCKNQILWDRIQHCQCKWMVMCRQEHMECTLHRDVRSVHSCSFSTLLSLLYICQKVMHACMWCGKQFQSIGADPGQWHTGMIIRTPQAMLISVSILTNRPVWSTFHLFSHLLPSWWWERQSARPMFCLGGNWKWQQSNVEEDLTGWELFRCMCADERRPMKEERTLDSSRTQNGCFKAFEDASGPKLVLWGGAGLGKRTVIFWNSRLCLISTGHCGP